MQREQGTILQNTLQEYFMTIKIYSQYDAN